MSDNEGASVSEVSSKPSTSDSNTGIDAGSVGGAKARADDRAKPRATRGAKFSAAGSAKASGADLGPCTITNPKLLGPKSVEIQPPPPGVHYGFPNAEQADGTCSVTMTLPVCPFMCQLFVGFFDLAVKIKNKEEFETWCTDNQCPVINERYDEYYNKYILGFPKGHLHAIRYQYNVDVCVSDIKEGGCTGSMQEIIIIGKDPNVVTMAVNTFLTLCPKRARYLIGLPCDHIFSTSKMCQPLIFRFIEGCKKNDDESDQDKSCLHSEHLDCH